MSYWNPGFHTAERDRFHSALLVHHGEVQHRLVSDPVNVAPGGVVDLLQYHNGLTIPDPQIVNLFAGTFWDDKAYVNGFTGRIVENGYLDAARGQGTKPGKFLGGFDIAPPPSTQITDAQVRAMLQAAVGKNGIIAPNPNALFLVLLPDGVQVFFDDAHSQGSCSNFCGFHSNDVFDGQPLYYTVQPATTCQGCFQGTPRIGLQMVIAHEIAEACTDPSGQGWFNDSTGSENADECAWVQDQYGGDIVQGYAAQNAQGQWVNSLGTYVAPQPPPPQHFKPSGPTAAAWQQLLAGGPLAQAELALLLASDPQGPAAPAWTYLLNGGDVQALLEIWGPYFHQEGAA